MPSNYNKYLRSGEWNTIKDIILKRDNHKCQECNATDNLTVHHKTYKHIFNETEHLSDLVTLCKSCHWKEHSLGEHSEFGPYVSVNKGCKFTKVFQSKDPKFDRASYYKCWHKIICNLAKNTNVIFTRSGKKRVCESLDDLIDLTDVSPSTFYKFYDEVSTRKMMCKVVFKSFSFYIVNPNYSLNGWKMPQILFDLFDNPLRDELRSNEEEE